MFEGLAIERLLEGNPIPKPLQEIPNIEGLEWIMEGFYKLSTARSIGMGVGPIPWNVINEYSETLGLYGFSRELFEQSIQAMDELFLRQQSKDK